MFAITSLLAVMVVSLLITRVATVILVATGMPSQTARFQARSAFTGAGFTTSESEDVVAHPIRRKVVMWLMLLGNAGIVATASALILGFRQGGVGNAWLRVLLLVAGMLAVLYASRSAWVDRRLSAGIGYLLQRFTDLPARDRAELLSLANDHVVIELAVHEGDWLADRSLSDLGLRQEGVAVLALQREGGRWLSYPGADTVLRAGDTLVLHGHDDELAELDRRGAGNAGDEAHLAALARYQERCAAERRTDTTPGPR